MAKHLNDGNSDEQLADLVALLAGSSRRKRQDASHEIVVYAQNDVECLLPYVSQLIDALYRPEAQTRWEMLGVLAQLAQTHPDLVKEACDGAEAALFDETSSAVRFAAFAFLAKYGASSACTSDEVWPLLDEALQCYHGDPEYRDMLTSLLEFAQGDLSEATKDALIERISFDATSGKGYIKAFSADILKAAQGLDASADK